MDKTGDYEGDCGPSEDDTYSGAYGGDDKQGAEDDEKIDDGAK